MIVINPVEFFCYEEEDSEERNKNRNMQRKIGKINENLLTGINRQTKRARLGYFGVRTQESAAPLRALWGTLELNTALKREDRRLMVMVNYV